MAATLAIVKIYLKVKLQFYWASDPETSQKTPMHDPNQVLLFFRVDSKSKMAAMAVILNL